MTPVLRQIVFINTAHTITHYSLVILSTAALAMAVPGGPFGSSYGPILALATGMFVCYGLLSLPQGWLAHRFGHKILMTAFFLGVAAGLIGAGFADSPTMLALALAFAGGFASIYHPITFLARHEDRRKCSELACTPAFPRMTSRLWRCRTGRCGSMPPGAAGRLLC